MLLAQLTSWGIAYGIGKYDGRREFSMECEIEFMALERSIKDLHEAANEVWKNLGGKPGSTTMAATIRPE
jgi:hypothetical protein